MCTILRGSVAEALGNTEDAAISSQVVISLEADQTTSVAVQLEGFSLVVVAYSNTSGNYIAKVRQLLLLLLLL